MRVVLLGAPGSGKGTQADLLRAKYGCAHISTGDILRKNLREKTELGLRADAFMNKGELVPDEIIIDMVGKKLLADDLSKGFLMDGFPRTVPQAEALCETLNGMKAPLSAALLIDIGDEVIVKRLTNRRSCRVCGKILNLSSMSAGNAGCPDCGGELYRRDDDEERVIRHRLQVYANQTRPLVKWYEEKGLLRAVQVREDCSPEETFKKVEAVLGL